MSFDIKYDRDGNVISNAPAVEQPAIEQEVLQQEAAPDQEPVEAEESIEQEEIIEQPQQQKKQKPTPAESFKQLKEAKEREERERYRVERERDEYAKRLRELEEKVQKQSVAEPDDDYSITINPDDLVEGKHLSKVDKKIKHLERQLQQYEQQTKLATVEARIKSQYPDFDSVVTKEHIATLQQQYPELAHTLNASNDLYATAVSAYTMIKRFGIAQNQQQVQEVERVQRNAAKPRPLTSVSPQQGESPLARANAFANGLTDELRKQLHKEMMEASKNL